MRSSAPSVPEVQCEQRRAGIYNAVAERVGGIELQMEWVERSGGVEHFA